MKRGMENSQEVIVYTMDYCPYCERAKLLLKQRQVNFKEVRVAEDDDAEWDRLFKASGMKTMPQIFKGKELIGGFTELAERDSQDELASLRS